jgi:RNA polymerase sigma-70 factor (ECF subfamily)
MTMQEDAILVNQTLAGDEQAFHRLIVKYQSAIYRLILSYVRNPDDAQELTQEVFLETYRDLGSLRQPEQFQFWLRQIARHQCQDWKRKRQVELSELQDNIIAESPDLDELLILRETLAKVMQAIDELPEAEKELMKSHYLNDVSYADLQAKHGLSSKALVMRLLRAREKVRQRVEKLLAGIGIFSWHDALEKMLLGGVEVMKISSKVKFIAIGVAAVLILGGTGVIVWHYQQLFQEATSDSSINQIIQKASLSSDNNQLSANNKTISDDNASKLAENQNLDANDAKVSGQIIASGTSLSGTGNSNIDPNLTRKIDVYNGLMRLLPVYRELNVYRHNIGKEIESLVNDNFDRERINNGNVNRIYFDTTSEGKTEIIPFSKQGQRIINDPYLDLSFV